MGKLLQSREVYRSKVYQGVSQKNLLPSPVALFFLPSTATNGGTGLEIGPIRFQSRAMF